MDRNAAHIKAVYPATLGLPCRYGQAICESSLSFAPFPRFAIDARADVDALAKRAVKEVLLSLFVKLHPAESKWCICLMNVAVANLQPAAGEEGSQDIGDMFRRHDDLLESRAQMEWIEGDGQSFDESAACSLCDARLPTFAMAAHARFHDAGE